jgi:hypothetical protein
MDRDKTGSKHAGTSVPNRCDCPGIHDNKTHGRVEIQGGLGSWQWFPALFTRDVTNCRYDGSSHYYLFHPVIIRNLVQECNVPGRYERSTEMVSIDTVNQADIRWKSRPDVTRRSNRNLSCPGTTGT